ncbi:MAG: hypothetical protein CVV05_00845 [Gammaproteobacteria bacterium HGW-Gammaproteobacteria-1]|jgi:hypothetical protein|nr:MAG: hypothetical protein CVV05_00845 [Gammaproteobacteria bacterium HGW-Gammaproteobacteria-1]
MTRGHAEERIGDLYGIDTEEAHELLLRVIDTMGLSALTDDAVYQLMAVQQEHNRRQYAL